MKRLIIMVIALLSVSVAQAQTDDHLQFRNIPITGSLNSFVGKLKSAGFQYVTAKNDVAQLRGSFVGYSNCEILVVASPNNTVFKIAIFLPEVSAWSTIKNQYETIKEQYSQKYGMPDLEKETIDENYSEYFSLMMSQLKGGEATYAVIWLLYNGLIEVSITHNGQIRIIYEDKQGSELNDKAIQDEI